MIELNLKIFTYALFIVMISSVLSVLAALYSLRSTKLPVKSVKIFQLYFLLGLLGWSFLFVKAFTGSLFQSTPNFIFYIIASFILFVAVVECARNWKLTWLIAFAHFAIILLLIISSDAQLKIQILSAYILCIYPFISIVSFKRAMKLGNIGNHIIGVAGLSVIVGVPFQIYASQTLDNINLSLGIILATSATGFVLVGIGFLVSILINKHKQLTALALNDPLTGLLNRRGLEFTMQTILAKAERDKACISAIAIDIDYFKKINDTYGHDGGDEVLKSISETLAESPRASDVCCRSGGEEFVLLLPETKMTDAVNIAERIRKIVEKTELQLEDNTINITASFGVSNHCGVINLDSLLKDADKALYKAKNEGRNRVCMLSTMK